MFMIQMIKDSNKRVILTLPKDVIERLDEIKKKTGLSYSAIVRWILYVEMETRGEA